MLMIRTLDAEIDLLHTDAEGWLIVADIAMKCDSFRIIAVYAPNNWSCLVFSAAVPDGFNMSSQLWTGMLSSGPQDRQEAGASEKVGNCSLVNLISEFGLIDRY